MRCAASAVVQVAAWGQGFGANTYTRAPQQNVWLQFVLLERAKKVSSGGLQNVGADSSWQAMGAPDTEPSASSRSVLTMQEGRDDGGDTRRHTTVQVGK